MNTGKWLYLQPTHIWEGPKLTGLKSFIACYGSKSMIYNYTYIYNYTISRGWTSINPSRFDVVRMGIPRVLTQIQQMMRWWSKSIALSPNRAWCHVSTVNSRDLHGTLPRRKLVSRPHSSPVVWLLVMPNQTKIRQNLHLWKRRMDYRIFQLDIAG